MRRVFLSFFLTGEGGRSRSNESSGSLLVGTLDDVSRKRELDVSVVELSDGRSLALGSRDDGSSDDVDGVESSSMSSGHIVVHILHGASQGGVSVLPVHIVGARSRVVSNPDAVVSHDSRVLLHDLVHVEDFSGGRLHLLGLSKEVPESTLGHDFVDGEDLHSVDGRVLLVSGRTLSANYLEQLHCKAYAWYSF